MPITQFCFIVACIAALCGMSLGIVMGISEDFSLTPVHAHLNLLGWVTMAIYGLYYRGREGAAGRLDWVQVALATAGFVLMTGGLALILTGMVPPTVALPATIAGSLFAIGAMALFGIRVVRDSVPRQG